MSHMIPPMVSTTPPPLGDPHEEEEDFGDFAAADYSFQIEEEDPESPHHISKVKDPWPIENRLNETDNNNAVPDVVKANGIQTLENGTDDEADEELKRCTKDVPSATSAPDNTSQDSVVSTNTDSGLCSASGEASPLPPPCVNVPECPQNVPECPQDVPGCPQSLTEYPSSVPGCPHSVPECPQSVLEYPTNLPEISPVSSGSENTLVVTQTNLVVASSFESSSNSSSNSLLPDIITVKSELTLSSDTTLCDSATVPYQSINDDDENSESQTNCDFQPMTITTTDDFGEIASSSIENDELCNELLTDSICGNSELTIKNDDSISTEGEDGVPLPDNVINDFGDFTNATSQLSVSSLPTDLSPTETENSLNLTSDFPSIAVNQTNTMPDDSLSFGDFESVSSDVCSKNDNIIEELSLDKSKEFYKNESVDDDEDFGDFESISNINKKYPTDNNFSSVITESDSLKTSEDFDNFSTNDSFSKKDEFCEFASFPTTTDESTEDFGEFAAFADTTSEGNFADFASTSRADEGWAEPFTEPTTVGVDDDDDFDDFESAVGTSIVATPQLTGPELVSLVTRLFPNSPTTLEVTDEAPAPLSHWLPSEPTRAAPPSIWPALRDVQSTPALDYQWGSSCTHNSLLGALGIDSRNILFGQRWNANMPRFAANLGQSPLEPVRADSGSSLGPSNFVCMGSEVSTPGNNEVVPAAQFDWTGSGLVNPLDSSTTHSTLLLDVDFLATFDKFSSPSASVAAWRALTVSKQAGETMKRQCQTEDVSPVSDVAAVRGELVLSAAALAVISNLPDLSFMRAAQLEHKSST